MRTSPYKYRTYRFIDKDPVIDKLRTAQQDAKESYKKISDGSGVAAGTLGRWFGGHTRKPQFCTVAAVANYLGVSLDKLKGSSNKRG